MKNSDDFRSEAFRLILQLQLLEQAAKRATGGFWTVNNPNETKWNVYDQHGNDIAIAQQVRSLTDDPKQEERTANAQWIALVSPKNVMLLTEQVHSLLKRVEELEGKQK